MNLISKFLKAKLSGRLVLLILALLSVSSCVQEIDQFGGSESPLIISGELTNEAGPHRVRVMKAAGFNVRPNFEEYYNADVRIIDDLGNEEPLQYRSIGYFYTSEAFQGEIGRSYHVRVVLASGETYESLPEMLNPVPEILDVNYETTSSGDVDFNIDYQDDLEIENFYRWRFSGVYKVYSPEELGIGAVSSISKCYPTAVAKGVSEFCWVNDFDVEFLRVGRDELYNGELRTGVNIYNVERTRKFNYGYNAKVSQYSLTKRSYDYWAAIQSQINNTGTIFETSNYQIVGNLRSLDDAGELVLGYFQVSAVASRRVHVDVYEGSFGDIPCEVNEAGCFPERCVTCFAFGASATDEKPDYWPN